MSANNLSRGAKIKSRLAENGLTSHWLMIRMCEEFGVVVEKTRLSQILGGVSPNGEVSKQVMDCAEAVLDRYDSIYKEGA